jgi:hypothetical protein
MECLENCPCQLTLRHKQKPQWRTPRQQALAKTYEKSKKNLPKTNVDKFITLTPMPLFCNDFFVVGPSAQHELGTMAPTPYRIAGVV